jgi:hypothetical protein
MLKKQEVLIMDKGKKGVVSFVFIFILTFALVLSFIPLENIDSCQDSLDCQSDYVPIYNRIWIVAYSIFDISSTNTTDDVSISTIITDEDIDSTLGITSSNGILSIADSGILSISDSGILNIINPFIQPLEQQIGGIYCGDGSCSAALGENYRNCPSDCCAPEGASVMPGQECCYGLINVEEIIPWQVSPTILRYCILCGDGICKEHENYLNCYEDCAECENLILEVEIIMGFDERLQPIQTVVNPIKKAFGI